MTSLINVLVSGMSLTGVVAVGGVNVADSGGVILASRKRKKEKGKRLKVIYVGIVGISRHSLHK
jgi:hypothetical protein